MLFISSGFRCVIELITELRKQDAIDRMKRFSSFEISRYKHIQGFQQFVKSRGIPGFELYIGRTLKELKCRSLIGPEKLHAFQSIQIC